MGGFHMPRYRIISLLALVSIWFSALACASNSPVTPSSGSDMLANAAIASSGHGRLCWGSWDVRVDLKNGTIDATPDRTADLHFDVVPLLKEKTPKSLLGFSNLLIDNANHTIQVDISLTHPYPTLPQLAGFDVRGILFTRGDDYALDNPQVILTGPNEPRLVNADGYTRWWNPQEFPPQNLLGWTDGKYGTPFIGGGYEITLAGYKYFSDALGPLDSIDSLTEADRGVFRAGKKITRQFLIDFGTANDQYLVFNYAVDANWGLIPGFKPGGAPPNVPGDFPLTANCPEPYRIRVTENTNNLSATSAGGTTGTLDLTIDVFDWQALSPLSNVPMEVSIVTVEAPAFGGPPVICTVTPDSGEGSMSTYTASLTGSCPEKLDYLDLVVTATSSEGNYQNALTFFQGSGPLQAFNVYRAKVVDSEAYSGWTHRYSRLLYPEYPNQGANDPDIAVYSKSGTIRSATIDQANVGGNPDSVNEWRNDYTSHSVPEHYHFPTDQLSYTGKWNDINNICVSDSSTRLFFTNTNKFDEFTTPDTDPLYCYLTWMSHAYLGNLPAASTMSVFFSNGDFPRFWATDPSNGLTVATDYIYSLFIYDVTGLAGGNPGADPQRYIIFRWAPPYDTATASVTWQRPNNVAPVGTGVGYVDRDTPYKHKLAVDDTLALPRFYILDSKNEIEVVDCDFSQDEFSGSFPVGTVTIPNKPADVIKIQDIECVQTTSMGAPRNYVAALCQTTTDTWRVWVFDFVETNPIDSQAVTVWLSEKYPGTPFALDALDSPVEAHVLSKSGGLVYADVFRDYP
jgi:hypothetical protein